MTFFAAIYYSFECVFACTAPYYYNRAKKQRCKESSHASFRNSIPRQRPSRPSTRKMSRTRDIKKKTAQTIHGTGIVIYLLYIRAMFMG